MDPFLAEGFTISVKLLSENTPRVIIRRAQSALAIIMFRVPAAVVLVRFFLPSRFLRRPLFRTSSLACWNALVNAFLSFASRALLSGNQPSIRFVASLAFDVGPESFEVFGAEV